MRRTRWCHWFVDSSQVAQLRTVIPKMPQAVVPNIEITLNKKHWAPSSGNIIYSFRSQSMSLSLGLDCSFSRE